MYIYIYKEIDIVNLGSNGIGWCSVEIHYGGYGFFHARARHFSLDFFDTALD